MTPIEYMHYRYTANPQVGLTVAIQMVTPTDALVAIARCGPRDMFSKKVGRAIASGRLASSNMVIEIKDRSRLKGEVHAALAEELSMYESQVK